MFYISKHNAEHLNVKLAQLSLFIISRTEGNTKLHVHRHCAVTST